MLEVTLEIRELSEQIRKLKNFDREATGEVRGAMLRSTIHLQAGWRQVAPVRTGRYRNSISPQVRSVVGLNAHGTVGTNVTDRGFPYPAVLEESPRYHYRATVHRGLRTAGQVRKVLEGARRQIERFFAEALERVIDRLGVR